jgi:hypothetical protein
MDYIIIIVKIWRNDPCANYKPNSDFKQYLKTNELLVNDNYKLMEEHDFFEELCKLVVINLVGWGGFAWSVIGSTNMCYN